MFEEVYMKKISLEEAEKIRLAKQPEELPIQDFEEVLIAYSDNHPVLAMISIGPTIVESWRREDTWEILRLYGATDQLQEKLLAGTAEEFALQRGHGRLVLPGTNFEVCRAMRGAGFLLAGKVDLRTKKERRRHRRPRGVGERRYLWELFYRPK